MEVQRLVCICVTGAKKTTFHTAASWHCDEFKSIRYGRLAVTKRTSHYEFQISGQDKEKSLG